MPRTAKPFDSYVRVEDDGCHIWTGAVNSCGYGSVRWRGKARKAHHVALLRIGVTLPVSESGHQSFVVMHTCDNRLCVKPSHLVVGTQGDNIADRQRKQRHARRDANHRWMKLSSEDVSRIREARRFGALGTDLAKAWGVAHGVIYRLCSQDRRMPLSR